MAQPTMNEMRVILKQEIEDLRNKKISPIRMKAVIFGIAQYIKSVRTEIEYQKLMGTKKEMSQFD
jgi:hypothetical protein